MKKQLPINEKAYPICFSHDANINSILSNHECVDDTLAIIDDLNWTIDDVDMKHYDYSLNNVELIADGTLVKFKSNLYDTRMQAILYNKINNDTEISFKVSKHLNNTPWAKVGIFCNKHSDSFEKLKDGIDFNFFYGC